MRKRGWIKIPIPPDIDIIDDRARSVLDELANAKAEEMNCRIVAVVGEQIFPGIRHNFRHYVYRIESIEESDART